MNPNKNDWICICGTNNFSKRIVCFKCKKTKPNINNKVLTPKSGDWYCGNCNDLNFINRLICRKCSTPKTDSTKIIMSQKDWICDNCKEINFEFRDKCFKCVNPKDKSTNLKNKYINELVEIDKSDELDESDELKETDELNECIICMEREKTMVITKCGHLCVCNICGYSINKCPLCRKDYNPDEHLLLVYK